MKDWIYRIAIYGTQHGGALMYGEVNATDKNSAMEKARSISAIMGHEISRITAELRPDEALQQKIDRGEVRATDAERKRYARWGLVAKGL